MPGSDPRCADGHVGVGPGCVEPLPRGIGLLIATLAPQCLLQPDQRPPVLRHDGQVRAVGCLGIGRPSGGQLREAERMARRIEPVRRLRIVERILSRDRRREFREGGIVVAVQRELGVPVKLVGVGERADDLAPFAPEAFVDALLGEE